MASREADEQETYSALRQTLDEPGSRKTSMRVGNNAGKRDRPVTEDDVIHDLMQMELSGRLNLDSDSVYGLAIAMPQIARTKPNAIFIVLTVRAYILLFLNVALQTALLCFVGQSSQVMSAFSGQMHLCDFGAALSSCPGGAGCMGPGGTAISPPRIYGYVQWSIQKFVKQAFLDIVPEQQHKIENTIDPGEYGMENYWCRLVACFIFALSSISELFSVLEVASIIWSVPTEAQDWIEIENEAVASSEVPDHQHHEGPPQVTMMRHSMLVTEMPTLDVESFPSLEFVKFQVRGMPWYWKLINFFVVLLPKFSLWYFVVWEGFNLLMESSGILEQVLGCLAMCFVMSIDELILSALSSKAARYIMNSLDFFALPVDHDTPISTSWSSYLWFMFPRRLALCVLISALHVAHYYWRRCKWDDALGLWVSQDMEYPRSVLYFPWELLNSALVQRDSKPFWTMPHPGD